MGGNNSGNRLFISYSRKNKEQVYPLTDALIEAGIDVWIDRHEIDPLDDFPFRIREGLAQSHALLAWYSPEYAQSSYCQKEITAAWICTQRLTCDILSRILIVNPEEYVEHIALGDVGIQNYLAAPKTEASLATFIQSIRNKLILIGHSDDFAALRNFKKPNWHPYHQYGSSRFVGRLRDLWRIHTALNPVGISDHENPNIIVQLQGLGGIGKSLLTIEYAKRFGAAYPGGIHWLRAYGFDPQKPIDCKAREEERQRQIEDLAEIHEIPISNKKFSKIFREVGKKLEVGERYLWIVDDLPPGLDQEQGFQGWCAPSSNGHTLITTRLEEYDGLGVTIKIDVLDLADALELLTKKRKPQNTQEWEDAKKLADNLGRHALALDVAGHFLLEGKGFAELKDELVSDQSDPLGKIAADLEGQLPGGHEKSIVSTFLQSLRLLKEEGLNLLRLGCELQGGTPIPFQLVDQTFANYFVLDSHTAGNYRRNAVNQLKNHCLATLSLGRASGDDLSIHALLRYTMLHGDPAANDAERLRQKLREAAVSALTYYLFPSVLYPANHAFIELDVIHAKHLVTANTSEDDLQLIYYLGRYEHARGNYQNALPFFNKALHIATQKFGLADQYTLQIRNDIAACTGNVRETLRLCRELWLDQKKELGPHHQETLKTHANIAVKLGENGDAPIALRIFQNLLPVQTKELGPDHPETFRTRYNIAHWTRETGKTTKALRLFQELLRDLVEDHGQDFDIIRTRVQIAELTKEPNKALLLFEEVLPDQARVFGSEHPDTLMLRANYAIKKWQNGDAKNALSLLRKVMPDLARVLGPNHPNTISIQKWIRFLEDNVQGLSPPVRHSGVVSYRLERPKTGRNDPCPCGSGLKFKRCHGKMS